MSRKPILLMAIFCLLAFLLASQSAFSTSKQKKMQNKIKQQQDTIDLLKLKLKKKNNGNYSIMGNSNNYSYPTSGTGKAIIPADAITYP
ncbi:MAG: hypothetical protein QM479_17030 [Pseudomonadota bacterium]